MQVLIAIIATIGSILGIIGLFTTDTLFYLGGILSFCGLVLYGEAFIRNKNKAKRIEIAEKSKNKEEKEFITKATKNIQIISRIVTLTFFIIIFIFFKLKGICWIGIVFGLLFIPEIINLIIKRAVR
jgi:hypothetical protein